ncbi:hypothetical protein ARMGADRAFT_1022667 [Armillaria gallica]|uniref:Uncharacterized protein n=1 Tax=Armillaria gallica TaxID=47427 RepID=A0A2H3F0S3_ARMGA|nr:hypothetical protein ARMGADRAFT_1022667 [Armillaria gallica]
MVIEIEGSTLCRLANIHDLLTFNLSMAGAFEQDENFFGSFSLGDKTFEDMFRGLLSQVYLPRVPRIAPLLLSNDPPSNVDRAQLLVEIEQGKNNIERMTRWWVHACAIVSYLEGQLNVASANVGNAQIVLHPVRLVNDNCKGSFNCLESLSVCDMSYHLFDGHDAQDPYEELSLDAFTFAPNLECLQAYVLPLRAFTFASSTLGAVTRFSVPLYSQWAPVFKLMKLMNRLECLDLICDCDVDDIDEDPVSIALPYLHQMVLRDPDRYFLSKLHELSFGYSGRTNIEDDAHVIDAMYSHVMEPVFLPIEKISLQQVLSYTMQDHKQKWDRLCRSGVVVVKVDSYFDVVSSLWILNCPTVHLISVEFAGVRPWIRCVVAAFVDKGSCLVMIVMHTGYGPVDNGPPIEYGNGRRVFFMEDIPLLPSADVMTTLAHNILPSDAVRSAVLAKIQQYERFIVMVNDVVVNWI